MRYVLALTLLAGCGVEIGGGSQRMMEQTDARAVDAAVDAPGPDARPCTGGDQNMMSGGQCYLLFTTTPRNWADANTACTSIGTRLAILDTAAKHTVAKTLAGTRDTWIGLTDSATEMQFRWVDPAVPLAFTAWDPMEPNNANGVYEEDCAIIAGARMGDWDDRPCSDQVPNAPAGCCSYAYICQF
jgi:hypothetical protein